MTDNGYQTVQANRRPLSDHPLLNQHVLSVFNKFVLAILIFSSLLAWFASTDTIDTQLHSMCSYRNHLTTRPEDQASLFPDFDHVPDLNGTATSVIQLRHFLRVLYCQHGVWG